MFLGIKAIEYTHKWDMGLLTAGFYQSQYLPTEHHTGLSPWLIRLSAIPALCVCGFAVWYIVTIVKGEKRKSEIAGPLLVTALCYFLGVFIGMAFQNAEEAAHAAEHGAHATAASHSSESAAHSVEHSAGETVQPSGEALAQVPPATAAPAIASVGSSLVEAPQSTPGAQNEKDVDQAGGAGLFFSIYYCMTGVHAIHILGGMAVLTWLLVRATKDQFNEEYFGPVDYVGLYWHLVDLIWIYLFPLLYLIK